MSVSLIDGHIDDDVQMTDNEIIRVLECHKDETNSCQECTYNEGRGCSLRLASDVLDLINRQKAEIERLRYNLKAVLDERADHSEAVKEFAERLKDEENLSLHDDGYDIWVDYDKLIKRIDNLVKEMVGEG